MKLGWLGAIFFVAFLMMLLVSIPTGEDVFANSTVTGPFQTIISYSTVWEEGNIFTLVNPLTHIGFFSDLFTVMIWGETSNVMFPPNSPWMILKWMIWGPVLAVVVFGLAVIFINIIERVF